jgi:hypothetical protein
MKIKALLCAANMFNYLYLSLDGPPASLPNAFDEKYSASCSYIFSCLLYFFTIRRVIYFDFQSFYCSV